MPQRRTLAAPGLALNRVEWGDPARPTLILQHGGLDHAMSWDRLARALADRWHVVAPDLRGHGDSGWSPDAAYAFAWHVEDFARVVDAIGKPAVAIVGHSFGGAIALRYAGLFPERVARLVAIEGLRPIDPASPPAPPADRWRKWIKARIAAPRPSRGYATIAEMVDRLRAANPRLAPDLAETLTLQGTRQRDGRWMWKYDPAIRADPPFDMDDPALHATWGRIACPVLLAWGHNSWATDPGADGRAAHFRDARVIGFEGAGHWVQHDAFERLLTVLGDFL